MASQFTAEGLRTIMKTRYPEVADGSGQEHPMSAVGVVLLLAATLGTTDATTLRRFSGYPASFISAISFNMQNNQLWVGGRYDTAVAWLSPEGEIDEGSFWDDMAVACGESWTQVGDTSLSVDTCKIYWSEQGRRRT